jgi:hypothetical protein
VSLLLGNQGGTAWQGAATFAGTGALDARAILLAQGAATFAGAGALNAFPEARLLARSTFAGVGTLVANAGKVFDLSASFYGGRALVEVDSYASSNFSNSQGLSSTVTPRVGQAFTPSRSGAFSGATFYLVNDGTGTTGDVFAELFATTGSSPAVPTGSPLAVSLNAVSSINIPVDAGRLSVFRFDFTFYGDVQITAGTTYAVMMNRGTSNNLVFVGDDATSPTHAGNFVSQQAAGTFTGATTVDTLFSASIGMFFADSTLLLAAEATLSGSGVLAVDATVVSSTNAQQGEATFAGVGTFIADTSLSLVAGATFAGVGTLVCFPNQVCVASSSFAGVGTFVAQTTLSLRAAATFAGVGLFDARANARLAASSTFSGVGAFVSSSTLSLFAGATFTGDGVFVSDVAVVQPGAQNAEASFAGVGQLLADSELVLGPRDHTEQGVARNLAKNLARLQRQDCRILVRCEPIPAGSNCEVVVRTSSRARVVALGVEAGSDPILVKGVCHAVASPDGVGVTGGSSAFAYCDASSSVGAAGYGLRAGGGRIRTRASANVVPAGAAAIAGSDVRAFARGVKNPTDEQLLAMAALAVGRRRLTRTTPRV